MVLFKGTVCPGSRGSPWANIHLETTLSPWQPHTSRAGKNKPNLSPNSTCVLRQAHYQHCNQFKVSTSNFTHYTGYLFVIRIVKILHRTRNCLCFDYNCTMNTHSISRYLHITIQNAFLHSVRMTTQTKCSIIIQLKYQRMLIG